MSDLGRGKVSAMTSVLVTFVDRFVEFEEFTLDPVNVRLEGLVFHGNHPGNLLEGVRGLNRKGPVAGDAATRTIVRHGPNLPCDCC